MSFHPYPQYKDSGVEWLGEVPEHWQSRKIAHAYSYIGGGTTPPSSEEKWYADGTIPWVTTGELRENTIFSTKKMVTKEAVNNLPSLRIHPKGSLLIALYGATIGRLGFLGIDATCNQACCVLANPSTLMENFTFYWLLAFKENIIKLFSTGGGQPNISQDVVLSLKLPAPSTEEQTQIARFLDHETSKIDGLIAEQERLIELLKEKRQATISYAVTKGLNPDALMKDSDVEWLGEVPEHWKNRKISHAYSYIGGGTTPPSSEPKWYEDGTIPWVTTGELRENIIQRTKKMVTEEAVQNISSLKIHPKGSLLIALYGATIARMGFLGVNATCNQACCVLAEPTTLTSKYTFYWLLAFKEQIIELHSTGGGQPNISQEVVLSLRLPAPSLDEQIKITEHLDRETTKLDTLLTEAQRGIELLKERRSALISAAVTGKIDVRSWTPKGEAA